MRDRSRGSSDEPEYDWLYGSERGGAGSDPRGSDPEPTRILPTMDRPAGAGSRQSRPTGRRPDGPLQPPPPPRRNRPAPATSGRPPRRRRPRLGWLKLVLVLWLVFLVAVPLWAWTQVDKVRADPGGDRPAAQPGTTYLLVGSDSREGLTRKEQLEYGTGRGEGRRTDTIMLLHTGSGPDLLMSIPRDSLVEVPGYGVTKINAAFAYGGPRLLVDTIENNTGIRIDDYIEIGFGGFVNVVDAVGGVEICPKRAMNDPQANLKVEKGCQEADGVTALGYARSRKLYTERGDIDRARAQREVVAAVGSEAASPWTVLNPVRYFRLADSGSEAVRVGRETSLFSAVRFAWAMTKIGGGDSLTCGVPIADLAVHWDRERADRLFRLIAEDRTEDVTKALCRQSGLRPG